jgi:membrane protein implicated in regulation of membrane protease activity
MGVPMLTTIMKWVCIAALLLAVIWRSSANYRVLLEFMVCAGAVLIVLRACRTGKYLWAAGFIAIAVLFNPVAPIALPRSVSVWVDLVCLLAFVLSLAVLRTGHSSTPAENKANARILGQYTTVSPEVKI